MKHFLLSTLMIFCAAAQSQTIMRIHQSNGTVLQIPISTIDSITYTNSNPGNLASLTTLAISNITGNSATSGGSITNDGGSPVTQRGICWATTQNPTTANNVIEAGSDIGSFTADLTGLAANTTYYVRAYAINTAGTAYGNQLSFTTTNDKIIELLVNGNPSGGNYTFFSFAEGKEIATSDSNSIKWDFGLRFVTFIINSASSGPGNAYVQILDQPFSNVLEAPLSGYKYDTTSTQKAIKGSEWYNYNSTTRQLSPIAGKTFVFVTAQSKYAKMEIIKVEPSDDNGNPVTPPTRPTKLKYTLRYFYQSNGTPNLVP